MYEPRPWSSACDGHLERVDDELGASAVGAAALAVDACDPLDEPRICESAIRRWPPFPGVKARAGDAEQVAHQRDRVVGLLRRDEPKQAHRVSLSFTKKAAAFFKISRSCSSSSTRRRSSRNS